MTWENKIFYGINFSHAYDILDVNLAELYMVEAVYNSFNEMNNARIAVFFCVNWYADFVGLFFPVRINRLNKEWARACERKQLLKYLQMCSISIKSVLCNRLKLVFLQLRRKWTFSKYNIFDFGGKRREFNCNKFGKSIGKKREEIIRAKTIK